MRRIYLLSILLLISSVTLFSQRVYLEFNQMMCLQVGADLPFNESFGFRGGLGSSIFSIKTINYSACFYYKLPHDYEYFDFYLDIGLPLAYFDLWEDKYVNWDPIIDSPYAGWLPGILLRTVIVKHFTINMGLSYWIEWQEDDGFKDGIMPTMSLIYLF